MAGSCTRLDSRKTCVAYLWEQTHQLEDTDLGLVSAQIYALERKLPLVVVTVIGSVDDQQLSSFEQCEQYLKNYDVPLMVLIGDPLERIAGFISHTNPEAIFADDEGAALLKKIGINLARPVSHHSDSKLQAHPYKWPGRVMNIGELREVYLSEKPPA